MEKRRQDDRLPLIQKIIEDIRFSLPIIVMLLGGTVYGNSETVRKIVHGKPPPTVQEIQPVEDGHLDKSVADIVKAIARIKTDIEKLKERDAIDQSDVLDKIRALEQWHE